jgi:transcriptional regulator with XRE-family HTH domain
MGTMAEFGERLRGYREQVGLSQRGMAQAAGMSPAAANRLEHGERAPTGPEQVLLLARALGLDPARRDALLASAGYWPADFLALGPADPILAGVAAVLASPALDAPSKQRFRQALDAMVAQWSLTAARGTGA